MPVIYFICRKESEHFTTILPLITENSDVNTNKNSQIVHSV